LPRSSLEFNRFLSAMPDVESPDLRTVLDDAETIAVVGCSATPTRTSHKIAKYMQARGYRIVPVNPNYDEVLGEPCYPDLPSIPADVTIDIVDIFRAPEHTADMVRSALDRISQTGEQPVIWTQRGVSSSEAEALAAEAGLPYVRNRCIKVAYDRVLA
jgi:predicted CoA-binding protein